MANLILFSNLIVILIYPLLTEASRILISAPFGTKSHKNMYIPLVRKLVDRGHQLTIITNYLTPDFLEMDNVTEIVLDRLVFDMSRYPNAFDKLLSPDSSSWGITPLLLRSMMEYPRYITETLYNDERIKQIMAKDDYDLVIVSQVLYLTSAPLALHFKAPMIIFSPNKLFPGVASELGDEEHTSYVPFIFIGYTDRMNVWQRTVNTVLTKAYQYISHYYEIYTISPLVRQLGILPDELHLQDTLKNVSLVFVNSHPTFTYQRTLPPQVIEVGGLHCRLAHSLPPTLQDFIAGAKEGFIIFGIGSLQQMEDMPERLIQTFIRTFDQLPQRIIWQWKGKIRPDLPDNVLAIPWLPQQDLLGHDKCRAIITHGGLNSLQEAIFHGVPVLGLPFGIDHHHNLARATNDGYCLTIEWNQLNEASLSSALDKLLHIPSFSVAAKRMSYIFRDQLQSPLERAVFWTEFVLRHNGTDHLRLESRNLFPFQRALYDVYLILCLSFILPFLFLVVFIRFCCRLQSVKPSASILSKKRKQK